MPSFFQPALALHTQKRRHYFANPRMKILELLVVSAFATTVYGHTIFVQLAAGGTTYSKRRQIQGRFRCEEC